MTSSDPHDEATSGKYNIRINSAQGPVIGDNLRVEQHFHTPSSSVLDVEQRRNRNRILTKVRSFWISGFLDQSLHGAALIALGLREQADAVTNPWERVVHSPEQPEQSLLSGKHITHIYEAFEAAGEELLILGEPGAGKTTVLLQLARELLDRAEQDETYPIPVVFNLSSWALKRQPLTNWLIEELNSKYQVPRKLGQVWVAKNQLTLLLDGLDEVKKEHRAACIEAINIYRQEQEHGLVPTVVCSRKADYFTETGRLQLRSAVLVQPLTNKQIERYLSSAGEQLEAVRVLLRNDPVLQELATTPLMLSVLRLAYAGKPIEALQKSENSTTRRQVFADYVERMLQRRGVETPYTPQQTRYWLAWLAQQLTQYSQSDFYIERMQPNWLPERLSQSLSYKKAVRLATGLFCALFGIVFFGLLPGLFLMQVPIEGVSVGSVTRLLCSLFCGFVIGLLFGITRRIDTEIRPAEVIVWSWRNLWHKLMGSGSVRISLLSTLFSTLVFLPIVGLSTEWNAALLISLLLGSLNGVVGGVISQQVRKHLDMQTSMPSQETYHPIRNRVRLGLSVGLLNTLLLVWIIGLALPLAFINGLIVALTNEVKTEIKVLKFTISLGGSLWRSIRLRRPKSETLKNGLIAGEIVILPQALLIWLSTPWSLMRLGQALGVVLVDGLLMGGVFTVFLGLINVMVSGLASDLLDKQLLIAPNQGIRLSARNGVFIGLLGVLLGELVFWLIFGPVELGQSNGFYFGLIFGIPIGLVSGLILGFSNGGVAFIQHWVLRWFLWRAGCIPWNYTHFLDYAAERILLRKVGGGYIFVHRLLLDYFASFNTVVKTEASEQVVFEQVDVCGCGYKETRPGARFCSNCGKPKQVTNGESKPDISSRPTEPL